MTCGPTHGCGTAACQTLFPGVAATTNFDGPSAWLVENAESSVYLAYFTSSAPFPEITTTTAAASSSCQSLSAVMSSSTARRGTLSPEVKVGIGLGTPLGVCACALMGVLLLLGYRRRQQRSSVGDLNAEGGSDVVADDDIGDKMKRGSGDGGGSGDVAELHGVGMQDCQNDLEGSMAEGREELA